MPARASGRSPLRDRGAPTAIAPTPRGPETGADRSGGAPELGVAPGTCLLSLPNWFERRPAFAIDRVGAIQNPTSRSPRARGRLPAGRRAPACWWCRAPSEPRPSRARAHRAAGISGPRARRHRARRAPARQRALESLEDEPGDAARPSHSGRTTSLRALHSGTTADPKGVLQRRRRSPG